MQAAARPRPVAVPPRGSGPLRVALYLLVAVFALLLLVWVRPHTDDGLIHQLGKNCALVAFVVLCLQAVLAARAKWIERPFGLDMVFRFHKAAGVVALALLAAHVTLVALGSHDWRLLTAFEVRWPVWVGRLALLALAANVVASLWRVKLRLEFQAWRRWHNLLAVAIIAFGFVHSVVLGGDLQSRALRAYWVAALGTAAAIHHWHKVLRPRSLRRRPYTVTAVRGEGPRIWTVELAPPAGESAFPYAPGQFHYVTFRRGRGLPVEEHHWTISSTPTRPGVGSTIKEVGDFTSTIGQTRVGDRADVDGAYGRFSYRVHPDEDDLVFVSGGIGVTPFLAMLRHMHDTGARKSVLLLWGNRAEQDLFAREELDEIAASGRPQLRVVHFLTHASEHWRGERGRIGEEVLARYLAPPARGTRGAYVCCPPPMAREIIRALGKLGVPAAHVHHEGFAL
jgi:predicted ferric reductase